MIAQFLDQRVKERTEALEVSYWMTNQAVELKEAAATNVLQAVKQHMATVSGLCAIAMRDNGCLSTWEHFQRMSVVRDNVLRTLDRIQAGSPYDRDQ